MNKTKLVKAVKILIILGLLLAISLLAILQWKSDLILEKVMHAAEDQLVDSLRYVDAEMDWFGHFPSVAVHISDLKLGSGTTPLIHGGDVDVVMGVWPLLKNKIIVKRIKLINATIHLFHDKGKWTYEIFKPSSPSSSGDSLTTKVDQLVVENSVLHYKDDQSVSFTLEMQSATFRGAYENEKLDILLDARATLGDWIMKDFVQDEPFGFELRGRYVFDVHESLHHFMNWKMAHDNLMLDVDGSVLQHPDHQLMDLVLSWEKGNLALLQKWLPDKMRKEWKDYGITGESEGTATIKGKISEKEMPRIVCSASLKNVNLDFPGENETIKGLRLNLSCDTGEPRSKQKSKLDIQFTKSAVLGQALEGKVNLQNLENPILDVTMHGSLPATLLNLLSIPSLRFEQGQFHITDFSIEDFKPETSDFSSFLENGSATFSVEDLKFTYVGNNVELTRGDVTIGKNQLKLDLSQVMWNKATVSDLKGEFMASAHQLDYSLQGKLCEGHIETKGTLSGLAGQPSCRSTWKVKSIDMKSLLTSFSNFDQTFITADHLSGKADIWAESVIPFDAKWQILPRQIMVSSALEIHDGRLQHLKTLEDFSQYIHVDDLRDIRFNQMRNYMKIENGQVYLPVMFIQSSAINLSISGTHGFDQQILYYVKVNAGQTASNKLKKSDFRKDLIRASKSGWINMYFVLQGTTDDVRYQQYRQAVEAGFVQSAAVKENLRNYLVEKFGYDVYWLEPNEWEDIPEYK